MEKNLKQINIQGTNVVPSPAQINCIQGYLNYGIVKSVKFVGREDVYNMEVKDHHNFSVNGGLIVHNSIDAIRYAMEDDMIQAASVGTKRGM